MTARSSSTPDGSQSDDEAAAASSGAGDLVPAPRSAMPGPHVRPGEAAAPIGPQEGAGPRLLGSDSPAATLTGDTGTSASPVALARHAEPFEETTDAIATPAPLPVPTPVGPGALSQHPSEGLVSAIPDTPGSDTVMPQEHAPSATGAPASTLDGGESAPGKAYMPEPNEKATGFIAFFSRFHETSTESAPRALYTFMLFILPVCFLLPAGVYIAMHVGNAGTRTASTGDSTAKSLTSTRGLVSLGTGTASVMALGGTGINAYKSRKDRKAKEAEDERRAKKSKKTKGGKSNGKKKKKKKKHPPGGAS